MSQEIAIDAAQQPIGRFCSNLVRYLKGASNNRVRVYGIGELVFSNRESTIDRYTRVMNAGSIHGGPFLHRSPLRLFQRTLRGMFSRNISQQRLLRRVTATLEDAPEGAQIITPVIAYRRVSIITLRELSTELGFNDPLAQQKSVDLLSQMSGVQIPGGSQD